MTSRLDAVYRSILITKFFTKGWGKPENLRRIFEFRKIVSNRDECFKLIPSDYPVTITKEEKKSDCHIIEGHFLSPLETFLPGVVPKCVRNAHFQVIMPLKWQDPDYKPMCVHLAGTGDHYFWRRRNILAKPLLKEAGIGAIILENPFYGLRKPEDQVRSSLHNVSDIFVMGGCLILETLVLLHWCERHGLGPLGVTGLSMGGHMASLAATNWPRPLVLVPCLSWSTASVVFTQGVMANSINWELLESQFYSDGEYCDKLSKMVTVVDDAFLAGRKFAQRVSQCGSKSNSDLSYSLPAILSNEIKRFDITNPSAFSSFRGIYPEVSQKYSVINTPNTSRKLNFTMTKISSVENSKTGNDLSENLYKKITSNEKFSLEASEIDELNKLAFQTVSSDAKPGNTTQKINSEVKALSTYVRTPSSDEVFKKNISEARSSALVPSPQESKALIRIVKDTAHKTSVELKILNSILKSKEPKTQSSSKGILSGFPFIAKTKEDPLKKQRNRDALQFMRGVMDECTHLGNFSVPFDTSLIIAVCAKKDAYIPRGDNKNGGLEELWPGAEIRYVDAGHVSAYVLHQSLFRSSIIEAFERSKKKWDGTKHSA